MTYTTNYNLNIVEGTDIVNPLTQFNPNFNSIDGIMKNNADAAVTPATCIKSGTVHTITRTNTGAEMFVFTATGDWNTGDTMTVDGVTVTPVLPDGTALLNGSYLINAEVLCSIKGTKVTVYSNIYNVAGDIVDNLTSTATDKALSANQGKVLNDTINTLVKSKQVTDTTNASGTISIVLTGGMVIGAKIIGVNSNRTCIPFTYGNAWFVTVKDPVDLSPIANTAVTVEVNYLT